jgi:hypothetical protein
MGSAYASCGGLNKASDWEFIFPGPYRETEMKNWARSSFRLTGTTPKARIFTAFRSLFPNPVAEAAVIILLGNVLSAVRVQSTKYLRQH